MIDSVCHFYVGDMNTPKMTFPHFEFKKGRIGFEPRVDGSEVWLDNVEVKKLVAFTYKGFPIPDIHYQHDSRLIKWESLGPFRDTSNTVEQMFRAQTVDSFAWQLFLPDARGCIVAGKVTAWSNYLRTAYFKYSFQSEVDREGSLYVSSTNSLAIWSNGRRSEVKAGQSAWYDVGRNEKHANTLIPVTLKKGTNTIYVRVDGQGVFDGYSGDGFFYYLK